MNIDEFERSILERARSERVLPTARREAQWAAIESRRLAGDLPTLDQSPGGEELADYVAGSPPLGPSGLGAWKMLAIGLLVGGTGGYVLGAHLGRGPTTGGTGPTRAQAVLVEAAPAKVAVGPATQELTRLTKTHTARETKQRTSPTKDDAALRPGGSKPKAVRADDTPTEVSLYEELSYLKRAQDALGAGSPELAYGLMKTLEESHPSGALLVERRVTEILALCGLQRRDEAARLARGLLKTPGSAPYKQRLEGSCAVVSDETGVDGLERRQTDPSGSKHE